MEWNSRNDSWRKLFWVTDETIEWFNDTINQMNIKYKSYDNFLWSAKLFTKILLLN